MYLYTCYCTKSLRINSCCHCCWTVGIRWHTSATANFSRSAKFSRYVCKLITRCAHCQQSTII